MVVSKTKHSKTKTEARSTQISKTKHPRSKTKHPKNNIWFKANKFIECVSETILPRLQHDVMKAERPLCPSFELNATLRDWQQGNNFAKLADQIVS